MKNPCKYYLNDKNDEKFMSCGPLKDVDIYDVKKSSYVLRNCIRFHLTLLLL